LKQLEKQTFQLEMELTKQKAFAQEFLPLSTKQHDTRTTTSSTSLGLMTSTIKTMMILPLKGKETTSTTGSNKEEPVEGPTALGKEQRRTQSMSISSSLQDPSGIYSTQNARTNTFGKNLITRMMKR